MRPVRFLRSAEQDIERIAAFLGRETPGRADRAIETLVRRSRLLGDFPDIGVAVRGGLRQMVFKDRWDAFIVRYRVTENAILVTRLWHDRENRPPR